MRNNMTASMFDLSSMKDKPRSPFSKLKGKMKGRKLLVPEDLKVSLQVCSGPLLSAGVYTSIVQ